MNGCRATYPYEILPRMYTEQRERLGKSLQEKFGDEGHAALFQAGAVVPINSCDFGYGFEQERYFFYLFGTERPDVFGAVLPNGKGIIFIPRLDEDYATWLGVLPTPESVKQELSIEYAYYIEEMESALKEHKVHTVHVMKGINTDSKLEVLTAKPPANVTAKVDDTWLFDVITEQRTVKTELEAGVMRHVCKVSSDAHIYCMQTIRAGNSQRHLESNFLHHVSRHGGCRRMSFPCIAPTGSATAILHQVDNDKDILEGELALLDTGGSYYGYAADITCTWPVNGKFTKKQKEIYDAVLEAHDAVAHATYPGVDWLEMHYLALRVIAKHLIALGILNGDVETIMAKRIMFVFQPHGLGHLLGLDVHDVGGYLDHCPKRPQAKDAKALRTARIVKKDYMMTIEPGCYFNQYLLENAFGDPELAPHFNEKLIREEYWDIGGVRIESDVMVTEDGIENYTVVPRKTEDVERVMAGEAWSGGFDVYHNKK